MPILSLCHLPEGGVPPRFQLRRADGKAAAAHEVPPAEAFPIERRLAAAADPAPLDPRLPRGRMHILLVTALPMLDSAVRSAKGKGYAGLRLQIRSDDQALTRIQPAASLAASDSSSSCISAALR